MSSAWRKLGASIVDIQLPVSATGRTILHTITAIEAQRSEPGPRALELIGQHFNRYPKDDPRYSATLEEQLEAARSVTLDQVKAFHKAFYGASKGELAIVGEFDPATAKAAVAEAFADWKSGQPYARVDLAYADVPAINRWIDTPDKENAVFAARINLPIKDDDPDFPALFLANYMLGGGAGLNSRLAERIRQKDGLSYGISSNLAVKPFDRAGAWQVMGIAAPQNVAKVEAAFKDELAKALKDGFAPDEIERARSGALQLRTQQRAQDESLAAGWASLLFTERTMAFSKNFDARLKSATKADIDAALRKYIVPEKITIVKAGDPAKAR